MAKWVEPVGSACLTSLFGRARVLNPPTRFNPPRITRKEDEPKTGSGRVGLSGLPFYFKNKFFSYFLSFFYFSIFCRVNPTTRLSIYSFLFFFFLFLKFFIHNSSKRQLAAGWARWYFQPAYQIYPPPRPILCGLMAGQGGLACFAIPSNCTGPHRQRGTNM